MATARGRHCASRQLSRSLALASSPAPTTTTRPTRGRLKSYTYKLTPRRHGKQLAELDDAA
jgi:hypothetical protein